MKFTWTVNLFVFLGGWWWGWGRFLVSITLKLNIFLYSGEGEDYTLNYHVSKDGKSLYCVSNRDVLIWDLKTGKRKYTLEHSCNVTDARTVDFRTMVTITEDKVVYLWDMTRPEKRGHKDKFNIGHNVWSVNSTIKNLLTTRFI